MKKKGDTAMQILQGPEARKILEAYQDGFITVKELREQLEWYWSRKVSKGTRRLTLQMRGDLIP
jgi:glycine cleavage system aminomethyltransferase T